MQILHVTSKAEVFSCILQHLHRRVFCSPGQYGAASTELFTSAKAGPKGGTYQQAWVPPHLKIQTFSHIPQQGANNRQHSQAEATQSFLKYAGDQNYGDDLSTPPSPFLGVPIPAVK